MTDQQIKQALALPALLPLLAKIPTALSTGYTALKAAPYVGKAVGALGKLPGMLKTWATAAAPAAKATRAATLAGRAAIAGKTSRELRLMNIANKAWRAHRIGRITRPASLGLMAMPAATRALNVLSGHDPEKQQQQPAPNLRQQLMQLGANNPVLKQYLAMGKQ